MLKYLFLLIGFFGLANSYAQKAPQKIKYKHADRHVFDKKIEPDAQMMIGNVAFEHEGTTLTCDSAVFYQGKNIMRAFGSVVINQADTLHMYSDYLDYHGDTKLALANGNVKLVDSQMTLKSDTVRFDRNKQIAFYPAFGEVKDSANTLTSIKGTYYTGSKKLIFLNKVVITNDKYVMKSDHLEYFTGPKTVYFYGPTTITSENNFIFCEKGFYDTKNDISYFKENSYIKYGNRTLEGDSLYYDRNRGFGSANKNITVNDSTKNLLIKGEYAEYYEFNDSTFVTDRALAINVVQNDSLYIHGDTLMLTSVAGSDDRLMRVFHDVKIYKKDLQGKCDSLSFNEHVGEMHMLVNPILWSGKNQLTSDTIIVTNNTLTNELDSLKLLHNGFIVSNDTILNYNQIKGINILGKFKDNNLDVISVVGNSETLYYARNEEKEMIGINKAVSSYMLIKLVDNEINEISFIRDPEAKLTPSSEIPENARKLKGFVWRNDERILSKEDLFTNDKQSLITKEIDDKSTSRSIEEMSKKGIKIKNTKPLNLDKPKDFNKVLNKSVDKLP